MTKKALIYCRVSSQKQVQEGSGNKSQEQRCEEYCRYNSYKVAKVFVDDGISGGLFDSPAMKKLIDYLDQNPTESYIIVFDDLSRFARDVLVYIRLKKELIDRGCKLESPNFKFDESEEGEVMELMTAVFNQYDRKKNRRQVIQKQKARLEQGYWPFCYPKGFVNVRTKKHGKLLTRSGPYATIYTQAIEGFADNLFYTQIEVQNFINSEYAKQGIKETLSANGTNKVLKNVMYAGKIEYLPWGVERREGQHKGLVSIETFNKVQEKLEKNVKRSRRADYTNEFALRGFVNCSVCGKPLTGSFNKGRNKYYPNYFCKQNDCIRKWKSINRDKLETEFENLLKTEGSIKKPYLELAKAVLIDIWNTRIKESKVDKKALKTQILGLQEQIDLILDRYSKTSDDSIAESLEVKIKSLKVEKNNLESNLKKDPKEFYTAEKLGTAFDQVSEILQNPLTVWKSENVETRGTIINMYFEELPSYDLEAGFGTTTFSYPIRVLQGFESGKNQLVEMRGVEPLC